MSIESANIVKLDASLKASVSESAILNLPAHIGVTMDGNGRWAEARGKARTEGHREGIKSLRLLVECAIKYKISYLTVFSFSSENWRRPKTEIDFIFRLMRKFVESDLKKLIANNVRVRIIGERSDLEKGLQKIIEQVEIKTAHNTGLNLNVAFNYGGRSEITSAIKSIVRNVQSGKQSIHDIDEDMVTRTLYTAGIPDPDLLIRTGGEKRTSNFLVWQSAYAELVFLDVLWPDFNEETFVLSLNEYASRQRRFGGIETMK